MVEKLSFLNWGFKPEKVAISSKPYMWVYAHKSDGNEIDCGILSYPTLQELLKAIWVELWEADFDHIFDEPWDYADSPFEPIYIYSDGAEVGPLMMNGLIFDDDDNKNIISQYIPNLTKIDGWLDEGDEVGDFEWDNYDGRDYRSVSKSNFNNWADKSEFLKKYSNTLENAPIPALLKNNQNWINKNNKSFLIGQIEWSNDWTNTIYKFYYKP